MDLETRPIIPKLESTYVKQLHVYWSFKNFWHNRPQYFIEKTLEEW